MQWQIGHDTRAHRIGMWQ